LILKNKILSVFANDIAKSKQTAGSAIFVRQILPGKSCSAKYAGQNMPSTLYIDIPFFFHYISLSTQIQPVYDQLHTEAPLNVSEYQQT
jgi:hypothetical protein